MALGDDLGDAGVGPVGLVDHQDHRQMRGQRLAQHEAGLGQRALGRVDEQQHAVDHGQPALDLATEVGVARGVDDVDDRHAAVGVVPVDGGVLRQDGDALFLLQVTGVHQALDGIVTAVGQGTGLPQHRVDQGRLPVVDVRDDGDIPKIHVGQVSQCGYSIAKTGETGHLKPSKLLDVKPKKKCCRSKPRCKKCPVVLHKVRKAELTGIRGKELNKIFKRARKN